MGWGLGVYVSSKLPRAADAASPLARRRPGAQRWLARLCSTSPDKLQSSSSSPREQPLCRFPGALATAYLPKPGPIPHIASFITGPRGIQTLPEKLLSLGRQPSLSLSFHTPHTPALASESPPSEGEVHSAAASLPGCQGC